MKKLVLLSLVSLFAVSLSACGGVTEIEEDPLVCDNGWSDVNGVCVEDEEEEVPVVVLPSQGVTATTVTVGNSAVTSGFLAFVGVPFNQGINAYFDMVNDAGGVAGRTIEFIEYDDEFNAATGITYAEKLLNDDKVFAFVGHFGTPTVSATLETLKAAGIPQVYYATGISALFNAEARGNDRSSFPVQPILEFLTNFEHKTLSTALISRR